MGLGGISIWQLLIILVIVVLLFGTKRLSTLGADLGSAIRGFRKSMQDEDKPDDETRLEKDSSRQGQTIDVTSAEQKETHKD